jgi:hypothetical protein
LYWEFYERGAFARAALSGDWKAVSPSRDTPLELFHLATDPSEQRDVASENPEIVRDLERVMEREHTPSAIWARPAPATR